MDQLLNAASQNWFWTVIGVIVVVSVLSSRIGAVLNGRARERSRREIAAYIAEGSMTPEQGERLMQAGRANEDCCG